MSDLFLERSVEDETIIIESKQKSPCLSCKHSGKSTMNTVTANVLTNQTAQAMNPIIKHMIIESFMIKMLLLMQS